ncbi:MAG: leucine dehydrogenase [Amoebophilaceae bacterium]|nr:leucine dehydrogenase [Amoebophilaceae bacterium]
MKIIEQPAQAAVDRCAGNHFYFGGHEQIVYFQHEPTALQAIVAIHDTTLGPALGGLRFLEYENESAALKDVLRLSRGMTYKSAIAGLDVGGGKAVILKKKGVALTEALLRKFGTFVDSLGGKYITAPDVNTHVNHMVQVAKSTRHIACLPIALGGSGDPSENTAYGVYLAMKAAVKKTVGTDSLAGKKIGVEGVGKVGYFLVQLLCQEKAFVYVTDICPKRLEAITAVCKVEVVVAGTLHSLPLDIYAPCALGATLNSKTIPKLRCAMVVGAANNQLACEESDAKLLLEHGILYLPDFLANAGGIINAATELEKGPFNKSWVKERTEQLYDTCLDVLHRAEASNCSTKEVAQAIAQERIQSIKSICHNG